MSESVQQGINICIDWPPTDETGIFRIEAADEILSVLVDAHDSEFTIPELVDHTDVTRSTVWRAVDLLKAVGVVQIRSTPQRNYVSIETTRLQKPDPILAVEQPEFHAPIRAFVTEVTDRLPKAEEIDRVVGILVFGSVARGEADRRSDVDLFVVVGGDRTEARRRVNSIVTDLEDRQFDGERFAFEPFVESLESAQRATDKLQPIFEEGIQLVGSESLTQLRREVMSGE